MAQRASSHLMMIIGLHFSHACFQTIQTEDNYCRDCAQTLAVESCPYDNGCSECLDTTVQYSTRSGCYTATVQCAETTSTTYVRLNRADGSKLDVTADELGGIRCSTSGIWLYSHSTGDVTINSLVCFHYPESTQQSPIDIMKSDVTYDATLDPAAFNFDYSVGDAKEMHVAPDRHGFTVYMQDDVADVHSSLTASHLDGTYKLYNVHAHWSDPAAGVDMGSEHLLYGVKKPVEFHFVHWNPEYGTFANAVGKPNGLAVVAVFAEIGAENVEFSKITSAIQIRMPITEEENIEMAELNNIDFNQLMPTDRNYFTYTGSLTTPEYNTCVIWTVLRTPITVSMEQLNVLRSLYDMGNARTVQDVISPIRSSFEP